MGIRYTIDRSRKLVTLLYEGEVAPAELVAVVQAIIEDPAFEPGLAYLADRRLSQAPTVDYARRAVALLRSYGDTFVGCRLALLVADPTSFGMARMGQLLYEDRTFAAEIFWDEKEALEWLGVGPPLDDAEP